MGIKGTTGNTMTLNDSFLGYLLGLPVECLKEIVVNTNKKQQSNLHKSGNLRDPNGLFGQLCMGNRAKQCTTGVVCWYSIRNIIRIDFIFIATM